MALAPPTTAKGNYFTSNDFVSNTLVIDNRKFVWNYMELAFISMADSGDYDVILPNATCIDTIFYIKMTDNVNNVKVFIRDADLNLLAEILVDQCLMFQKNFIWQFLGKFQETNPIVGPGSSTDNAIVRWDGTTALVIQNSTVIVDDDGSTHNVPLLSSETSLTFITNNTTVVTLNNGILNGIDTLASHTTLTFLTHDSIPIIFDGDDIYNVSSITSYSSLTLITNGTVPIIIDGDDIYNVSSITSYTSLTLTTNGTEVVILDGGTLEGIDTIVSHTTLTFYTHDSIPIIFDGDDVYNINSITSNNTSLTIFAEGASYVFNGSGLSLRNLFNVENIYGGTLLNILASMVYIGGDLTVQGNTFSINHQQVNIQDSFLYLNNGYIIPTYYDAGLGANILPTATIQSVIAVGFTQSSVNVVNGSVFAAGDLIQIANANIDSNNGLFVVSSSNASTVFIDITQGSRYQNTLTTDASAVGIVQHINLASIKTITTGFWAMQYGNNINAYTTVDVGTVKSVRVDSNLTINGIGSTIMLYTGTLGLADNGVQTGVYVFPTVTVDAKGRVSNIASGSALTSIRLANGLTTSNGSTIVLNGDTVIIANTGVQTGVYVFPTLTVNSRGQITNAVSGSAITVLNLANGLTTSNGSTIALSGDTIIMTNTVAAGSVSLANITYNAQGRITAASSGTAVTSISQGTGILLSTNPIVSTGSVSINTTGVVEGTYEFVRLAVNPQGQITYISTTFIPDQINLSGTTTSSLFSTSSLWQPIDIPNFRQFNNVSGLNQPSTQFLRIVNSAAYTQRVLATANFVVGTGDSEWQLGISQNDNDPILTEGAVAVINLAGGDTGSACITKYFDLDPGDSLSAVVKPPVGTGHLAYPGTAFLVYRVQTS
jgi:hypothetical protein